MHKEPTLMATEKLRGRRLIGTIRREFLDHVEFWNGRDLEHTSLPSSRVYDNEARGRASSDGRTPPTFIGEHACGP